MTSVKWVGDSRATALERGARASRQRLERSRPPATLPPLMVVAIWFGLVTGLLEVGLVYARSQFVDWSTLGDLQISRHFPWMIPLANLVLFLAWGVVVVILGRVWKRIGGQTSIALLSFPACLAPLMLMPGLYWTAYLALAGALATCIGKWVWAVRERFCRLVIRSLPVVCILTFPVFGMEGEPDRTDRALGDSVIADPEAQRDERDSSGHGYREGGPPGPIRLRAHNLAQSRSHCSQRPEV